MAERAQAGINGSRKKGAFFGRFKRIEKKEVAKFMSEGVSQREIARRLSCSASAIYKIRRDILLEEAKKNASGVSLRVLRQGFIT